MALELLSYSSGRPTSASMDGVKRRKLRKGTRSCWECKRRKMKCTLDSLSDAATCESCQRRGTPCISQEVPEELSFSTDKLEGTRMPGHPTASSEGGFLDGTSPTSDDDGRRTWTGMLTPSSLASDGIGHLAFFETPERVAQASNAKREKLSQYLHASLPSREDTATICSASRHPAVLAHEVMTMPYSTLDHSGLATPETLLDIPQASSHPVLIARHMFLLATFLQHLDPDLHREIKGLSESPRAIMERLTDLATNLMTTNDELIGSIEGLQCVMLESVYHANIGNLRRSWVASRRAMSIAQLMGLNRLNHHAQYKVMDPKTKHHPRLMWFRIVFMDRYLCLLLGLSQGSLDRSMASGTMLVGDTPMGRLERIHCVVASRVLERNESSPGEEDLALLRALDTELQKATRTLPSRWWLAPDLDPSTTDAQTMFWNTRRLFAQVYHYNLINQLHLPYMLRSSSSERRYEYSRITCVNAAREMISRFFALRRFNGTAYSCRTVDFLAIMAAMTLLLAHLESQLSEADDILAHQYHMDVAMVEKVQENMQELNRLNSDPLSAQSADLLRRLLLIVDVDATDCGPHNSRRVSVQEAGSETAQPNQSEDAVLSVHIPYFGIIKIAREGMTKELSRQRPTNGLDLPNLSLNFDASGAAYMDTEGAMGFGGAVESQQQRGVEGMNLLGAGYRSNEGPLTSSELYATANSYSSDPLMQQGALPDLAAGADDWAFQGVDWAFFENLVRGCGDDRNGVSE